MNNVYNKLTYFNGLIAFIISKINGCLGIDIHHIIIHII